MSISEQINYFLELYKEDGGNCFPLFMSTIHGYYFIFNFKELSKELIDEMMHLIRQSPDYKKSILAKSNWDSWYDAKYIEMLREQAYKLRGNPIFPNILPIHAGFAHRHNMRGIDANTLSVQFTDWINDYQLADSPDKNIPRPALDTSFDI